MAGGRAVLGPLASAPIRGGAEDPQDADGGSAAGPPRPAEFTFGYSPPTTTYVHGTDDSRVHVTS